MRRRHAACQRYKFIFHISMHNYKYGLFQPIKPDSLELRIFIYKRKASITFFSRYLIVRSFNLFCTVGVLILYLNYEPHKAGDHQR